MSAAHRKLLFTLIGRETFGPFTEIIPVPEAASPFSLRLMVLFFTARMALLT